MDYTCNLTTGHWVREEILSHNPILYLKSPEKACQRVKQTIDKRRQQPNYWLSGKNPMQNIARRVKTDKDHLVEQAKAMTDRVSLSSPGEDQKSLQSSAAQLDEMRESLLGESSDTDSQQHLGLL